MLLAYVLLAATAAVVCSGSCPELKCSKPSGRGERVVLPKTQARVKLRGSIGAGYCPDGLAPPPWEYQCVGHRWRRFDDDGPHSTGLCPPCFPVALCEFDPPVEHAAFVSGCSHQRGGALCTARCDPGYEDGRGGGAGEYRCALIDGAYEWQPFGGGLECVLTGCASHVPSSGALECRSGALGARCPLDAANYCAAGFASAGNVTANVCNRTGEWTGGDVPPCHETDGLGAKVPHRVTTGARPTRQLKKCNRTLAALIRECWEQRPDFGEIVLRTEAMLGIRPTPRAAGGGRAARRSGGSRPLLPPRGVASDAIAEEGEEVDDDVERAGGVGLSRPASPES